MPRAKNLVDIGEAQAVGVVCHLLIGEMDHINAKMEVVAPFCEEFFLCGGWARCVDSGQSLQLIPERLTGTQPRELLLRFFECINFAFSPIPAHLCNISHRGFSL